MHLVSSHLMVISIIIIIINNIIITQKDLQQHDYHLRVRMALFLLSSFSESSIMDNISFGVRKHSKR